ncbi:Lipopolysaccharide-assembly [Flexibacter flexilis DSM 6793]|uniref:Lipopolysaccharide-assembly n=1 Tax=Flexibacter flexilis DSM 6793 TaxID=927664 RepID=A0A1I1F568_9BACT|nr:Lipopolysaccharide-assembly [Flexibacter flexilis DSM 6793]
MTHKLKIFRNNLLIIIFLSAISVSFSGCGVYSFSPASINPDIKTIAVPLYADLTGMGPANLSRRFTEKTRDYYQRNTKLSVVTQNPDLQLDCSVVGYQFTPVAPTSSGGTEQAAQTRLTVTVEVTFTNNKTPDESFEKTQFSAYGDFAASVQQSTAEAQLIEEISDQIILKIFNQTVANW